MLNSTERFILRNENNPWVRGKHDCVLFIWKYTSEVHKKPFANPDDYPFYDLKTAYRALKRICKDNHVETFEGVLDKHYYRVDLPMDGGLVAKPDTEGLTGYSYGISYAGWGFFVGPDGIQQLELNPTTDLYWSIT